MKELPESTNTIKCLVVELSESEFTLSGLLVGHKSIACEIVPAEFADTATHFMKAVIWLGALRKRATAPVYGLELGAAL